MDWNGDGKHDWQDDAIFHNVIDSDNNSSSNTSSGRKQSNNGASFHFSQLGTIVIVLDLLLCVAALFMGYANIIGDLLGFGAVGFLIAQLIDG